MKLYLNIIIIALFSEFVLAQTKINPNGYNKLYFPNGSLQSEGLMKNGQPEGYWINYYPTGIKKSEGKRFNYQLDSIWIFYTITGDTLSKINYLEGKKNGFSYEYVTNSLKPEYIGNLKSKELFINNKQSGKSFYYYDNGKIFEEVNFSNNKRDGICYQFNDEGKIITIVHYRNGDIIDREKINRLNEDLLKEGIWKEFYNNYKVKKEYNYKDGLIDGYYKEYDQSGKLTLTLLYRNGNLVENVNNSRDNSDEIIEYFEDGSIKKEGFFKDNKPIGIHKEYTKDSNKTKAFIYNDNSELLSSGFIDQNGLKTGIWEEYYPDRTIKAKGNLKNNYKNGSWNYFFPNGSIEQKGNYINGQYDGKWYWYHPDGNIWKEEEFYNGLSDGYYKEFDKDSNLIVAGNYIEGNRDGKWITQINDYKAIGNYVSGYKDGKWKHYYDNGNISFEGNFIQGKPDGKHKYYWPDGSLKEEQFYNQGIKQKHWKKFNEDGELIITITYVDNIEYRINGLKVNLDDKSIILK